MKTLNNTNNLKSNIMKTIIISIAILSASIFNYSYANGNNGMEKILEKGISFKNGELAIDKNQNEFVRVSFRVNEKNKIEIIETNSSNEFIKEKLLEKLTTLTLFGSLDIEKVYFYNFTFKKQ